MSARLTVVQESFKTVSKGFEFTFSSATLNNLMEPTTPIRNTSPGFEMEDNNITSCFQQADDSSTSSYSPSESDKDIFLMPPPPSPYSLQNLPPLGTLSAPVSSKNSPFRVSTPDSW